jgi:hypothetical protein
LRIDGMDMQSLKHSVHPIGPDWYDRGR